jgi:ATP-dependent Clp protease ATP-binding subunit ClpA
MVERPDSFKFVVSDEELEELIHKYCRDYTELCRMGRYDPISGRERETLEVTLILLQKGRKNAVLLAPAGVGKTALVVGLAQQINAGTVPDYLKNARVIEIDLPSMAAGTSSPAEFQARFIPLCRGLAERYHHPEYPKVIMFIDEIHTIMPSATGSAYAGLSEVMKPYLTIGDLHVIGATTLDEFRIYVKPDPALDRRFQQVPIKIPNEPETVKILKVMRAGYEKHHKVKIPDECIERIVKLTSEHLPRRNQPDKSIIVMDGACAYHVLFKGTGGELDFEDINRIVSIESKIHQDAL